MIFRTEIDFLPLLTKEREKFQVRTGVQIIRHPITYCRIDNSIGNAPKDCPKSYTIQGSNNNAYWYNIAEIKDAQECVHNKEISGALNNLNEFLTYRILVNDVPGKSILIDKLKYDRVMLIILFLIKVVVRITSTWSFEE